jgi:hypothetical protein
MVVAALRLAAVVNKVIADDVAVYDVAGDDDLGGHVNISEGSNGLNYETDGTGILVHDGGEVIAKLDSAVDGGDAAFFFTDLDAEVAFLCRCKTSFLRATGAEVGLRGGTWGTWYAVATKEGDDDFRRRGGGGSGSRSRNLGGDLGWDLGGDLGRG